MEEIRKLVRLQIGITVLFIFFKLIRPWFLKSNVPELFKTILLSLPNLIEAVIGILILTGIGLYLNLKFLSHEKRVTKAFIYIIATVIAAVYVITQEFKVHNLGGENVFDEIDVLFSVIGLIIGYGIVAILNPGISGFSEEGTDQ